MKTLKSSTDYANLSEHDKLLFPAALSHDLTIAARDCYVPGTEGVADPSRLRAFNELQHRISSQQRDMLKAADRYPDDVFIELLVSGLEELGCSQLAVNGLTRVSEASHRQTNRTKPDARRRSA